VHSWRFPIVILYMRKDLESWLNICVYREACTVVRTRAVVFVILLGAGNRVHSLCFLYVDIDCICERT